MHPGLQLYGMIGCSQPKPCHQHGNGKALFQLQNDQAVARPAKTIPATSSAPANMLHATWLSKLCVAQIREESSDPAPSLAGAQAQTTPQYTSALLTWLCSSTCSLATFTRSLAASHRRLPSRLSSNSASLHASATRPALSQASQPALLVGELLYLPARHLSVPTMHSASTASDAHSESGREALLGCDCFSCALVLWTHNRPPGSAAGCETMECSWDEVSCNPVQ